MYIYNNNNEKDILLDEKIYMLLNWLCIDDLFIKDTKLHDYSKSVGYHWFNGSDETKKYLQDITISNIPNKYKGAIFKEKNKWFQHYNSVVYFNFEIDDWATFYKNKLKLYVKILNKKQMKPIEISLGKYCQNLNNFIDFDVKPEKLFIIDELAYNHLLLMYTKSNNINKKNISYFLNHANYICFFCELFSNNELQTIGCKYKCFDFAKLFFKNAKKNYICNTKNINYLYDTNIIDNITYFPPIGYSKLNKNNIIEEVNYVNDLLFYGNIMESFKYRISMLEKVKSISKKKNYKFWITDRLYEMKTKLPILSATKIVLHIPSHEDLNTFPWAKVAELVLNKIFFIIEENEEMYIQGLDKLCIFYKRNNTKDLEQKINYYLNSKEDRDFIVNRCYNYFKKHYNLDKLLNFN